MKVLITRPTIAQKQPVSAGQELDVTQLEALQLIGAGKAVAVKEAAAETTDAPKADVETSGAPDAGKAGQKGAKTKKASGT